MPGSQYGNIFHISTFGESHGPGIGVIIDGCPAGLSVTREDIQKELDKRRPGRNAFVTPRNEPDTVEILSGIVNGVTLGIPIALLVRNTNVQSKDYSNLMEVFRPSHADFGYDRKYGVRDVYGGGRSSGRETIGRVAAGAIAKKLLATFGITFCTRIEEIGGIRMEAVSSDRENPLNLLDPTKEEEVQEMLLRSREDKDSVGGIVLGSVKGLPVGLGEPVFQKLDAMLSAGWMSIGGVKGVEVGSGFQAASMRGSTHNDPFVPVNGGVGTASNHAGGILGGLSVGTELTYRVSVKPTPSIGREQQTVNRRGEAVTLTIEGRHDPSLIVRVLHVIEAMTALTLADALLMNATARMDSLMAIYGKDSE